LGFFLVSLANAAAGANTIAVHIALSNVGDPGNLPDPTTGYGAVPYTYAIGTYDVTLSQYTTFLNAVASSGDPYGLYNLGTASDLPTSGIIQTSRSGTYSYTLKGNANGNFPLFDVTWGDAARFVNSLANGQPTGPEGPGTTETGTYVSFLPCGILGRGKYHRLEVPRRNIAQLSLPASREPT
jgi:hypothetical protein